MRGGIDTVTKNKLREFGAFMGLLMFPVILILMGTANSVQVITDYAKGNVSMLVPSFFGYSLAGVLVSSVLMIGLGAFILWASVPKYKEYFGECGSR
jgi:hypothetical protein